MTELTSFKLKPTLWRTCRALANRIRLKLLHAVLMKPDMTVTSIAAVVPVDLPVASKYLRDLNARGLLSATRRAAEVCYRVQADPSVPQASSLVRAITETFRVEKKPVDYIFQKVTAFTHPRRIAIAKELRQGPMRFVELQNTLRISSTALKRHLRKLISHGFVFRNSRRGVYFMIKTGSWLETTLLRMLDKA